jgi:hypothetical protein
MIGILFFLGSILFGIGLVKKAFPFADKPEKVFWGMSVGILLSSWAGYLISRVLHEVNYIALIVLLAAIWIAAIFLLRKSFSVIREIDFDRILLENRFLIGLFIIFLPIFGYFLDQGMFRVKADGLYLTATSWGDMALHIAITNSFLYAQNFPPMYMVMPGEPLRYPYLPDFHAAIFLKFGWSLWSSFALTAFVSAIALIGTFYCFARRLAESKFAAFLASLMFLFSGGFGFLKFFKDWTESGKSFFGYFFDMKENYTDMFYEGVKFVSLITSGVIPQRAMLYGMPVAFVVLAIFAIVWKDLAEAENADKWRHWQTLFFAGFLTGLLPLYHVHSYMSVGIVSGFLFLVRPRLAWFAFWLPAVLLAVPQIFGGGGHFSSTEFVQYHLGWTHYGDQNFIVYLLYNFGLPLLLIFPALIFVPKRLRTFYIPFAAIFIFCFLFRISPNDFDNIKLLYYWYAATAIVLGFWLSKLARMPKLRFLVIPVVLICTASGILATIRETKLIHRIFSTEEIEAGTFSRDQTAPRALFLTGQNHNQPALCLAGRQILLGYDFWITSHGYSRAQYDAIKNDVKEIYAGTAKSEALIEKYKIDYVYIGSGERNDLFANEDYFKTHHTQVFKNRDISIYKTQKPQN